MPRVPVKDQIEFLQHIENGRLLQKKSRQAKSSWKDADPKEGLNFHGFQYRLKPIPENLYLIINPDSMPIVTDKDSANVVACFDERERLIEVKLIKEPDWDAI